MDIVTPDPLMLGIFTDPSKFDPSRVTAPRVFKPAAETIPDP
jgi:hypothetical protein